MWSRSATGKVGLDFATPLLSSRFMALGRCSAAFPVLANPLFGGLRMGFHKPEPFVYATGNLGENVSRIGIIQFVRLIDRIASFMSKSGQRFGNGLDMSLSVSDIKRVFFKARTGRRHSRSALGDASQWHDALRNQI